MFPKYRFGCSKIYPKVFFTLVFFTPCLGKIKFDFVNNLRLLTPDHCWPFPSNFCWFPFSYFYYTHRLHHDSLSCLMISKSMPLTCLFCLVVYTDQLISFSSWNTYWHSPTYYRFSSSHRYMLNIYIFPTLSLCNSLCFLFPC